MADAANINTVLLVTANLSALGVAFLQLLRGHERRLERKEWREWKERVDARAESTEKATGQIIRKQVELVDAVRSVTPPVTRPIGTLSRSTDNKE